jgi:hypothetical protein
MDVHLGPLLKSKKEIPGMVLATQSAKMELLENIHERRDSNSGKKVLEGIPEP